jgi:hypothetical protein
VITGFTNNTTYTVVVRAINTNGVGKSSVSVSATPVVPFRWVATAGSNIELLNDDLTARQKFGRQNSVLSTRVIGTNQTVMYSVEITGESGQHNGVVVGFGTTSTNVSEGNGQFGNYIGNDSNSFGLAGDGVMYYGGSSQSSGLPSFGTAGDIIDVAIYEGHGWWVRVNGGNWNNNSSANPATNTGGLIGGVLSLSGLYPGVTPFGYNAEGAITIHTTSTYTIPTGYTFLK